MSEAYELQDLAAESARTDTYDPTRYSFKTRRDIFLAAQIINPADPFGTIITQHTTVLSSATTRHTNGTR